MAKVQDEVNYDDLPTIEDVNGGLKQLEVILPTGKKLKVDYSQADYTPKLEREMQEKVKEGLPGNMIAAMLIKVLKGWNLHQIKRDKKSGAVIYRTDDATKPELEPVPLTAKTLDEKLSIKGQSLIVDALAEDQRPNESQSENSDDAF